MWECKFYECLNVIDDDGYDVNYYVNVNSMNVYMLLMMMDMMWYTMWMRILWRFKCYLNDVGYDAIYYVNDNFMNGCRWLYYGILWDLFLTWKLTIKMGIETFFLIIGPLWLAIS